MSTALFVLEHASLQLPLVIGAYTAISLMKVPDLSIEAAYVSGAIFGAQMLKLTASLPFFLTLPLSLVASIIGGVLVATVSSMLTSKAKLPHLLSSVLTLGLFHGINQYTLGSSVMSLSKLPAILSQIPLFHYYPELPVLLIISGALMIISYFFFQTELGISLALHGQNPQFFKHYGISRTYIFRTGLLISNGLAGSAGFLDACSNGFVDITMGNLKALFCITSIILGKSLVQSISKHREKPINIFVPVIGVLFYFTIVQLLLKVGFDLKYFTAVQSALVALILIFRYRSYEIGTDNLGV